MKIFPSVLNVQGRQCLVVGDDRESRDKFARLKKAGAFVKVIKPKNFHLSDIQSQFLVIFCPKDEPLLARRVFKRCRSLRILLCAIDQPEFCDVVNVAIYERGDLKILISTSGVSPSLAKKIVEGLSGSLRHVPIENKLRELRKLRHRLFQKKMNPQDRRKWLINAVKDVQFSAQFLWKMSKNPNE